MEDLKVKLKQQIIEALNLQGMKPEDIDDNAPLFGDGLGLDSIDSLEMMVLLERNYGIKIEDAREGRKVLQSVQSMAEYIQEHRKIKQPHLNGGQDRRYISGYYFCIRPGCSRKPARVDQFAFGPPLPETSSNSTRI